MRINKKYLKSLSPCKDGWDNYIKNYSDFDGSIVEFLELDEISFEDKKWVLFRDDSLIPESLMREFALICACRAIDDANIQELTEYFNLVLLMYESGENLKETEEYNTAWDAAWDAARDAAWDAARDAAWYAARYAAWDTARYAARYAARDATWDADRYAAWDAARDAAWDAAWDAEEKIQLDILINLVEEYQKRIINEK